MYVLVLWCVWRQLLPVTLRNSWRLYAGTSSNHSQQTLIKVNHCWVHVCMYSTYVHTYIRGRGIPPLYHSRPPLVSIGCSTSHKLSPEITVGYSHNGKQGVHYTIRFQTGHLRTLYLLFSIGSENLIIEMVHRRTTDEKVGVRKAGLQALEAIVRMDKTTTRNQVSGALSLLPSPPP